MSRLDFTGAAARRPDTTDTPAALLTDTLTTDKAPQRLPGARDKRLDVFRGLALVMIFIDHVPGTFYEQLTSHNFGFSDAAEPFVFMSGMAAGLAYSMQFRTAPLWPAVAKIWGRARYLYMVHILTTLLALAIFAAGARYLGHYELLAQINIPPILTSPLGTMIGIPLMAHQLGYVNILPLYIVLLLATPLFIVIALRQPLLLLLASIVLWVLAGHFRLNIPNYPTGGGWFFDPFSWQLIFVIGLLGGVAMRQGKSLVPYRPAIFWLAVGYVVLSLFWTRFDVVSTTGQVGLTELFNLGFPHYIVGFDKSFLPLSRLLHVLSLIYIVSSLSWVDRFASSKVATPLALMGQYALPVFAAGTITSIALQVVRIRLGENILIDGLLLAGGLILQVGLAWSLSRTVQLRKRALLSPEMLKL
ncbi:MAG TPA: OpgC domain-containing protein [Arsenicitalea sp.]|nr:OpgC domain-containing protein [Arsenicitalea sp.]